MHIIHFVLSPFLPLAARTKTDTSLVANQTVFVCRELRKFKAPSRLLSAELVKKINYCSDFYLMGKMIIFSSVI